MQNIPHPEKAESLRVRLIRGESLDSATLEELSEMLGMSPGGEIERARADKVHEALLQYRLDGLIEVKDTGLTRPVINTFHIHTISRDNRPNKWPVHQVKVYTLDVTQLSKVKPLLLAAGLWSMWGDKFCGASTEVLPSASEQSPNANSHIPFQPFKKFADGKWRSQREGASLDSLQKNKKRSPYAAAFNGDGTVNQPKFIEIATSRGEWKNDWKSEEAAFSLEEALGKMSRIK